MWQRFTENARRVVFFAQEEAQKYGSQIVSTEHLLLGLVRQESTATIALAKLNIDPNRVLADVAAKLGSASGKIHSDMTLSPSSKQVIDLAYEEARSLSNQYIGTEHLLLGLIAEKHGIAAKVLTNLGADLQKTRDCIAELQSSDGRIQTEPLPERQPARSTSTGRGIDFSKYPMVSDLFYSIINDSEDEIRNKFSELMDQHQELRTEISKLLLES